MVRIISAAALLLAAILAVPSAAEPGHLLIVGGGLSRENEAVYRALIDNRPEDSPNIVIVAAASGYPADSAARAAEALEHHGVSIDNIVAVRLAVVDDPDTADVDESGWASNVSNADEIAKIETAGAIWFTGGDQARLTEALLDENGADTLMMAAIRIRLSQGAVVGGTSAGAAAVGDPMIVRGDPFGSLFAPVAHALTLADDGQPEPLTLTRGLGLFRFALVDQHFAERGRLGRLVQALMAQPANLRIGLGVDEDTALLVDLAGFRSQVIGNGNVTLIDARENHAPTALPGTNVHSVLVSRLQEDDRFDLRTLSVLPAEERAEIDDRQTVFGSLWPSVSLASALETDHRTLHIAESRNATSADYSVTVTEGKSRLEFRFQANEQTRYWRSETDIGWGGTLVDAVLEISTGGTGATR